MSIKPRDIDKAWEKVGMEIKVKRHRTALLRVNGQIILTTARSHGSKMLDGIIPDKIRNQMGLDKAQFRDLMDCPLKRDGYLEILKGKKYY